jgi:hypothetical protein
VHNKGMLKMKLVWFVMILSVVSVARASEPIALSEHVVSLENFEEYPSHAFPQEWKVRGNNEEARQVYRITEEKGNHFLHAYAEKQEVQIGLTKVFPPQQFPILRWRWRVEQFPVGADERATATNDSAAGVYVVFDSSLIPRVIKYVWSASLPVGTEFNSPVYWRAKVVVLESGPAGEWKQETVNFYEDYKKLFGFEPTEMEGVALLTDADSTGTVAEADYDDFTLLQADAAPTVRVTGATASVLTP